jgi:hypothetical protein
MRHILLKIEAGQQISPLEALQIKQALKILKNSSKCRALLLGALLKANKQKRAMQKAFINNNIGNFIK